MTVRDRKYLRLIIDCGEDLSNSLEEYIKLPLENRNRSMAAKSTAMSVLQIYEYYSRITDADLKETLRILNTVELRKIRNVIAHEYEALEWDKVIHTCVKLKNIIIKLDQETSTDQPCLEELQSLEIKGFE